MALSRAATAKRKRLLIVAIAGVLLVLAAILVANAFRDSIVFFFSPNEVAERLSDPKLRLAERRFRLGGLVAAGSVVRSDDGRTTLFTVTDGAADLRVTYTGLLPDLFREGQGVVAEGRLDGDGLFVADSVLARHDENYMPKEVADALKRTGHWQHMEGGDGKDGYGGAAEP